jgi:hypothetical protein
MTVMFRAWQPKEPGVSLALLSLIYERSRPSLTLPLARGHRFWLARSIAEASASSSISTAAFRGFSDGH